MDITWEGRRRGEERYINSDFQIKKKKWKPFITQLLQAGFPTRYTKWQLYNIIHSYENSTQRSLLQLPASSSPTSTRVVYYLRIWYKKDLKFSLWNRREITCPVRPREKTKIKKWKATCNNHPEKYDLTGRYLSVLWQHSFDTFFKILTDFHWKSCWFSTTLAGRLLRSQSFYELLLQSCLGV